MLSCAVKEYLNVECPGCGMQRAFMALLQGDISSSFVLNPALIPFLLTFGYMAVHLIYNFKCGARNTLIFFCLTLSLMIVNFVVRIFSHL